MSFILTLVIHEAPAELLEGSPVAHGPERAVELVVGHHKVLRVTSHVDHLKENHNSSSIHIIISIKMVLEAAYYVQFYVLDYGNW